MSISQCWEIFLVVHEVFFLLHTLGRLWVGLVVVVVIIAFKLVANSVRVTTSSTTASCPLPSATASSSSAATLVFIIVVDLLLDLLLVFLLVLLPDLCNLLLKLGSAILLVPCLLLLNLLDLLVQVFWVSGGTHLEQAELLNYNKVKLEHVFSFNSLLFLLLALLLLASADDKHVLCLTFLLGLGLLNLSISKLLSEIFARSFSLVRSLHLLSNLFISNNQTWTNFELITEVDHMVTRLNFFLIRVGKVFQLLFTLLLNFLLKWLLILKLVYLSMQVFNMMDFMLLLLVVVSLLPVFFFFIVFRGKQLP